MLPSIKLNHWFGRTEQACVRSSWASWTSSFNTTAIFCFQCLLLRSFPSSNFSTTSLFKDVSFDLAVEHCQVMLELATNILVAEDPSIVQSCKEVNPQVFTFLTESNTELSRILQLENIDIAIRVLKILERRLMATISTMVMALTAAIAFRHQTFPHSLETWRGPPTTFPFGRWWEHHTACVQYCLWQN